MDAGMLLVGRYRLERVIGPLLRGSRRPGSWSVRRAPKDWR